MKPVKVKSNIGRRHVAILIFGLCLTLIGFGCADPVSTPQPHEPSGQVTQETTMPDETEVSSPFDLAQMTVKPDEKSGPLRLWWPQNENRHPLLSADRATRAVYDLMYEGLFSINASQGIENEIAASMQDPSQGTTIEITLQAGKQFHDGSPIAAEDVAASLSFILEHPQSYFAPGLFRIDAVQTKGDRTIILELTEPDPWLAYALTFPIVSAQAIADLSSLPPGSGAFILESQEGDDVLTLSRASSDSNPYALSTIKVHAYRDFSAAMQGFADDEIDLVVLSNESYRQYRPRSSLRFDPFSSGDLIVLSYQTQNGAPLAESEAFNAVKKALHAGFLSETWHREGIILPLPLPRESVALDGHYPQIEPVLADFAAASPTTELHLIWPDSDPVRELLASQLADAWQQQGISIVLEGLAADDFIERVLDQDYDLAMLQMTAPKAPDPSWLYLGDDYRDADSASFYPPAMAMPGHHDYVRYQDLLAQTWHDRSPQRLLPGEELSLLLSHVIARAPWDTLIAPQEAILYGARIIGQSRPHRSRPYEGIEDLWVWSSQPSS